MPAYPSNPSPYIPYKRDAASYQQASSMTNKQAPQNLRAPQNMPEPMPAQAQYMVPASTTASVLQQYVHPNSLVAHEQEALTVSIFVHSINQFLHNLGPVLIKGEISTINPHNHLYFTLKDKTSSVQCLMFQNKACKLSFKPEIGQQVLVAGSASLYNKKGSFTLLVDRMEQAGQGLLMEQLRLLELKLEQEGLFARQRPLPRIIQCVAVVTSLQGMARDDFIYNATTRNPLLEIILFETTVQGAEAPLSICSSLNFVYQHAAAWGIDVVVLTRGGGSFEDLLCFYDENVARMVARSPVPIISAVGHDKNSPICDRAADMRVSTPTAAAIAVTPITRDDILAYLNQATTRATNALLSLVDNLSLKCDQLWRSLERSPVLWQLQSRESALDALTQRLEQDMHWHLQHARETISNQEKILLQHAFSDRINTANQRWFNSMRSLERFTSRLDSYEQRLCAAVQSLQNVKALETTEQRLAQLQQRLLLGYSTLQNKEHTASNTCSNLEQRLQEAMAQHLARALHSWQQNYQALQLNYEQHLQPQLLQHRKSALHALTQSLEQAMQRHLQHAHETISNQEKLLLQHAFSDRINTANQRWFNSMRSLERFTSRLDSYEQRLSAAVQSLQNVKALETTEQRLAQLQQRLLLGYSTLQNKEHTASNTCSNLEQRLQEAMSQHLAWAQRSWQQNYQALQLNYEQHLQPQLLQHRKSALDALTQSLEQAMHWQLQHAFETISNQEKLLLQHAFSDRINTANQRWFNSMRSLERFTSRLDSYEQRLSAAVQSLQNVKALETAAQRLAQLQQRLLLRYATLQNRVHTASTNCSKLEQRLQEAMSQHLARAQRTWQQNYQALQLNYEQHLQPQLRQMQTKETLLYSKLLQLNPFYQLDHGWSLTTLDGKHSVAAADLSEGSEIITLLKGAEVHSTVTQIIPKEHVAREESVAVATTSGDEGGDDDDNASANQTAETSPA